MVICSYCNLLMNKKLEFQQENYYPVSNFEKYPAIKEARSVKKIDKSLSDIKITRNFREKKLKKIMKELRFLLGKYQLYK